MSQTGQPRYRPVGSAGAPAAPEMSERLDIFMARAVGAYYRDRDPFADFVTAPELAQAFGEVLGAWAVVVWEMMGAPVPVRLVEAGPGRGTLMADALRAIARVKPRFRAALRLHLIETSPRLREVQAARLAGASWHHSLDEVPDGPMILLANEFLDALPIRQFVRRGDGWAERYVAAGVFVERPAAPLGLAVPEGSVVEIGLAAQEFAAALGARLAAAGGAALMLDYGHTGSAAGETLQALRDGRPADPLADPGAADLTAHVDFAALARAGRAAGAAVHGPVAQGLFLQRLGLFARTERLAEGQPPAQAAALRAAAARLAGPSGMGSLFKALALSAPDIATLPGFAS